MDARLTFYQHTISRWIPDHNASVLVVAGGTNDRDVFHGLGFTNVLVSSLDERIEAGQLAPYGWSRQDAEALTFGDGTFDYVVVHDGLHHCHSPHRALLDMYRVARRAVVVFDPCDNALVRLMQRFGMAPVYEVYHNDCRYGAVANTEIPNHVYRWTENEIRKTIATFNPVGQHRIQFAYGSENPCGAMSEKKGFLKRLVAAVAVPAYRVFTRIFPKQQNLFSFIVEKPTLPADLHPWLVMDASGVPHFNADWEHTKFVSR